MKKIYLVLYVLFSSFLGSFAQLTPVNVKIVDDFHKAPFIDPSSSQKRSLKFPAQCDIDTVEYPYWKAIASNDLVTISISRGRSLGQLYSCPKPLVLMGFSFYGFVAPTSPAAKAKKMNLICNVYKAGPDSLPRGLPLRSDTITIDSTFGRGVISNIIKHASWTPILLDSNYIITVETDSANMSAGIVTNNYAGTPPNGRGENLNCGSISGLWYNGRNLNVNGIPFDCDVLLHPHVRYKLGADFAIKNNCYNINDTIKFVNTASSNFSGSRMYNIYMSYRYYYPWFCHIWDVGDNFGPYYNVDQKVKYNSKQNYEIRLESRVFQYRSTSYMCTDTVTKTIYFKPDIPTFSGLTNLCVGDTVRLVATSADTGVYYEWLRKPTGASFYIGKTYEKAGLTKNDTLYLRANNHGCVSGVRTVILRMNAYPTILTVKNDSVCAGSKASLKASTNAGTLRWYTSLTGGLPFYSGSVYQTQPLFADTMFYVEAGNNGCLLNPRQAVRALVGANFAPLEPNVSNDTTVCLSGGSGVTLTATATPGLTIRWFDVSSGGSSINTGNTFNFNPSKREIVTYYVDAFNGICGSTREPVNVTVEDYPAISNIVSDTICKGDSAYLSFTLPFGTATWFDSQFGGSMVTSGESYVSAADKSVDYYIETSSDVCVSPLRAKLSATVNTFPDITKLWGDTICSKNPATLKCVLNGSGNVNWYESDTTSTILSSGKTYKTPILNGSKKYYVEPFYAGCIGPRQSVQPLVKASPFSGFSFEVMTWQRVKVSPINASGVTVKWYFGDGATSNSANATHRYETPGTYSIKLVLTSTTTGCKDSTIIPVLIETSSINALAKLPDVSMYPNPVNLALNVHSEALGDEMQEVKIYSTTGVLVHTVEIHAREGVVSIPVSGLSAGLYMIQLNGYAPMMFVKE